MSEASTAGRCEISLRYFKRHRIKTYDLLMSPTLHLLFSDPSWAWVTETPGRKDSEGDSKISASRASCPILILFIWIKITTFLSIQKRLILSSMLEEEMKQKLKHLSYSFLKNVFIFCHILSLFLQYSTYT